MLGLSRWLLGRGLQILVLFVVIVAILALANDLPGRITEWQREATAAESTAAALAASRTDFDRQALAAVKSADAEIARLRQASLAQLDAAERDLDARREIARGRVLDGEGLAWAVARGSSDAILASYRAQYVDLPLVDRASALVQLRQQNFRVDRDWRSLKERVATYNRDVAVFNQQVRVRNRLQAEAQAQRRNPLCRQVTVPVVCRKIVQVRRLDAELATARRQLASTAAAIERQKAAGNALKRQAEAVSDGAAIAAKASREFADKAQALAADAASRPLNQARTALQRNGAQAAWLVLLAVSAPIVFAMFRYYVLAHIAARSAPLRLRAAGPVTTGELSRVSVGVEIDRDSELLLRSGAQERAVEARVDDMLVLDWQIPLTCMAAGLVNLQRFRSDIPESIMVTGGDDDPQHEVALVRVPDGGALVLKPRALVGVIKPRAQRLGIQRCWRIFSTVSWLTLQFRYLTFSGPCTLIVQGTRGVNVAAAQDGRAISRRLVLGFDAGLGYSAVRSASFRPYLFGQSGLFEDRFAGTGSFVYQTRPAGFAQRGILGRGLKGVSDAILNAVGV